MTDVQSYIFLVGYASFFIKKCKKIEFSYFMLYNIFFNFSKNTVFSTYKVNFYPKKRNTWKLLHLL